MVIGITQVSSANNYVSNTKSDKHQVAQIKVQQVSQPVVKQNEDSNAEKVAKKVLTRAGMFVAFAGGQALANIAGLAKQVENPKNIVEKVQNALSSNGAKFENTALSWVERTKNLINRKQQTDKLISQAGLDTTV